MPYFLGFINEEKSMIFAIRSREYFELNLFCLEAHLCFSVSICTFYNEYGRQYTLLWYMNIRHCAVFSHQLYVTMRFSAADYASLCIFVKFTMRHPTDRGQTNTRHYTSQHYASPCGSSSDVYSSLCGFSSISYKYQCC